MKTVYTHTHDRSKNKNQTNIGFICTLDRQETTSIIHRESVENRTPHKHNVLLHRTASLKCCYYRRSDSGCVNPCVPCVVDNFLFLNFFCHFIVLEFSYFFFISVQFIPLVRLTVFVLWIFCTDCLRYDQISLVQKLLLLLLLLLIHLFV